MENASNALLIAAGIFFGIIIITMSLFMYNQVSDYYESKEADRIKEQLATFNSQYLSYQKDNLRGSDLLSLINKIIDFNKLKNDEDPGIEISIEIGNSAKAREIYYQYSNYNYGSDNDVTLIKINSIYNQNNIESVLKEVARIENKYSKGMAEKLTTNLSTLLGQNDSKTRQELLTELRVTIRSK